jgi:hypothetical protein
MKAAIRRNDLHHNRMQGYSTMNQQLTGGMGVGPSQRKRDDVSKFSPIFDPPSYLDCIRYNAAPRTVKAALLPQAPIIRVPVTSPGALDFSDPEDPTTHRVVSALPPKDYHVTYQSSLVSAKSHSGTGTITAPFLYRMGADPHATEKDKAKQRKRPGMDCAAAVAVPVRVTYIPEMPQHIAPYAQLR